MIERWGDGLLGREIRRLDQVIYDLDKSIRGGEWLLLCYYLVTFEIILYALTFV